MENNEQQKANHLASIHGNETTEVASNSDNSTAVNHLASVHSTVKDDSTESTEELSDDTCVRETTEEVLGETPEVLPTELGGIKLED